MEPSLLVRLPCQQDQLLLFEHLYRFRINWVWNDRIFIVKGWMSGERIDDLSKGSLSHRAGFHERRRPCWAADFKGLKITFFAPTNKLECPAEILFMALNYECS